jgi:hypothetical protein
VSVRYARCLLVVLLLVSPGGRLGAQHVHHTGAALSPFGFGWSAQGIGLVTHAAPAVFGRSLTEGYLTQPAIAGHLSYRDRLLLEGMLNLEGWTLRRGELNAGTWGEGYIDRRHPHTFAHEAMATVRLLGGPHAPRHLTGSFGKGFVPFGTDDPMARPFVKYPANHHLAQILERLVGTIAYREGPIVLEAALFNGDEPAKPGDFANVSRFGDSWAVRATVVPFAGLEASLSTSAVASPEFPAGSGLDHRKWAASVRLETEDERGGTRYALAEWARTDEYSGGERSFRFHTALAEAASRHGPNQLAVRAERTVRPEEERLLDPFRTPRPHADANILGSTRWWLVSARAGRTVEGPRSLALTPFAEVGWSHARATLEPTVFVPAEFYGSDSMWSLSAGLRIDLGARHHRMGRYGAARIPSARDAGDRDPHPRVHERGSASISPQPPPQH